MCLVFVAAIIGCYFIPNPAGGEIMRYFILFVGYASYLTSTDALHPRLISLVLHDMHQAAISTPLCMLMMMAQR